MSNSITQNGRPPAMNPVHCRAVVGLRRVARRRRPPYIISCARLIVERVKRSDKRAILADWRWRSPFFFGNGVLSAIGLMSRFRWLST